MFSLPGFWKWIEFPVGLGGLGFSIWGLRVLRDAPPQNPNPVHMVHTHVSVDLRSPQLTAKLIQGSVAGIKVVGQSIDHNKTGQ